MLQATSQRLISMILLVFSFSFITAYGQSTDDISTPSPVPIATLNAPTWMMGFDASYVTRVEDAGGLYRDSSGDIADVFDILASYTVDIIRLRVWVNPEEGYNNKDDVLDLATRAHNAGMGILLNFHYSDFWADPSQQTKPDAWQELEFAELQTAVYDYTADIVGSLIVQGTPPEMVAIGNEIIQGMLWTEGQVGSNSPFPSPIQWQQLATLLNAGIDGVKSTGSTALIMIHIDNGGENNERGRWFFDHLVEESVPFDIIATSYYPAWHGDLDQLADNIRDMRDRYEKPVIVVETSTMWTLNWNDWTHNSMGETDQLHLGYEATPQGQDDFFQAVVDTARDAGAVGVFYWGGEWIATASEDTNGSAWENQALFDFDGNPLPAFDVYKNN